MALYAWIWNDSCEFYKCDRRFLFVIVVKLSNIFYENIVMYLPCKSHRGDAMRKGWLFIKYIPIILNTSGAFLCVSGLIVGLHPANGRRRYEVMPSVIGLVQT